MSTRSLIKIEGIKFAKVYKHCDGYPEGMLRWLEQFNSDFAKKRGNDPEYKFAQLLRSSVQEAYKFYLGNDEYTGWGVVPYNATMGESYIYTLHTDGCVSYKEVTWLD